MGWMGGKREIAPLQFWARNFLICGLFLLTLGSCAPQSNFEQSSHTAGGFTSTADELTEDFLDGILGNSVGNRATNTVFPRLAKWERETPIRVAILGRATKEDREEIDKTLKIFREASRLDLRYAEKGDIANFIIFFPHGVPSATPPKDLVTDLTNLVRSSLAQGIDFTEGIKAIANSEVPSRAANRFTNFQSRFLEALSVNYTNNISAGSSYCTNMRMIAPSRERIDDKVRTDTAIVVVSEQYLLSIPRSKQKCLNTGLLRAAGFSIPVNAYLSYRYRSYPTLMSIAQQPTIVEPTNYDVLFLQTLYSDGVMSGMTRDELRPIMRNYISENLQKIRSEKQQAGSK